MKIPMIDEMIDTVKESATNFRQRISNVRYGAPGTILFDFDGKTYQAKEPTDIMPVGGGEAGKAWAAKQLLQEKAKLFSEPK